jgi:hypothetical protein
MLTTTSTQLLASIALRCAVCGIRGVRCPRVAASDPPRRDAASAHLGIVLCRASVAVPRNLRTHTAHMPR